jgi:lipopolysaccharide/colanic/teichoic acid biosynthesis glycosyltransferase
LGESLKRGCDLILGLAAFLLCIPVILVIAAVVLAVDGRPVMFRQVRIGLGGAPFTIFKFRTMRNLYDPSGELLPDDRRTTALGAFLRRFRLDELPEFWLVFTGKMSLVGPRPLPQYVLEGLAGAEERSTMRPGLTGLAQVSGNIQLNNREKFAVDLYYGRHRTIGLDFKIMFQTLATLAFGGRRDEDLIRRALAEWETGARP